MSEIKTPIRTLNGHALVDETARQGVAENAQRVSALSEEIDALYKKLLTEDIVNALIDSKLGVIENGTY